MGVGGSSLDVAAIKRDFPILQQQIHGDKRIVYLDSANTSQKPQSVIDAMASYYETINANVHRGTYKIAEEATNAMEGARKRVASFIGAKSNELVFTKNATESVNLVANTWGRTNLNEGDAVVLTMMEHHANIVPWHMLAAEKGIELRWIPLTDDGQLDLTDIDRLVDGAKLVSFTAMSNVLGTINPVQRLTALARDAGAMSLVDASQHVPHIHTDVTEMGADFLVFTGHKMLGPTGIGGLWATEETLNAMPPFLGGGEMILNVTTEGFTTTDVPWKFEAGTPPIAEIVGLGAAVDYLSNIGMDAIRQHEVELTGYALRTLNDRFGDDLTIHGPAEPASRGGVMSIQFKDIHPHDLTQVMDQNGVCLRAGNHCAKPLMKALGANATARASLYLYNDESDIDALGDALQESADFFDF